MEELLIWAPQPFSQQLVYSRTHWRLTPALVNLEQVSDSGPVPSDASVRLQNSEGWGVSSVLTPSSPLCLDPRSANSTYCLLPLLPLPSPIRPYLWPTLIHSRAPQDAVSLSANREGYVLCYLSLSVPFSTSFFFSQTVGSHCITAPCYKTPSHCKRISFY